MMASSVDNLVLEQLYLIRDELGELRGELASFKADTRENFLSLDIDIIGLSTKMIVLGMEIGQIDKRLEQLEQKIGA